MNNINHHKLLLSSALLALVVAIPGTARADYPAEVLAQQPLAYYRFSETGPFTWPDNVATNIGSVATNGAYSAQEAMKGKPGALNISGAAASFDGLGQNITVGYNAALNPSGSFTAEAWFKPALAVPPGGSQGNLASPISSSHLSSPRSGWLIYQSSTGWNLRLYNQNGTATSVNITGGGPLVADTWYHVVWTYDGNIAKLYVNGTQVAASTPPTSFVPNVDAPLTIGTRSDYYLYHWQGSIDEVAFYGTTLSDDDIKAHFDAATTNGTGYATQVAVKNPLLYLRLDDAVVPNPPAANVGSLGAVANGIYRNGLTPATSDLVPPTYPGLETTNRAVSFDGTGQLMSIGSTNVPAPWSAVFWLNRQDAADASAVLLWSSSTGIKLEQWGASAREMGFTAYGVADYYFNYAAPTGTWVNVAYVGTPTSTLLYVNGSLQDSNPASITLPMTSLGNATVDRMKGSVDELALFGKALTEAQLKTLYLTGVGDTNPPGLLTDTPTITPTGTIYSTMPFALSIDAYGSGPLTYEWRKDGTTVGTSATYSKTADATADQGNYDVIVRNNYGAVTSAVVTVTINPAAPPNNIVVSPVAPSRYPGGSVTFKVTADGTTPFTYQWKHVGTNLPGATFSALAVTGLDDSKAGNYSVGLTNVAGGAVSPAVNLVLRTPAVGTYEAAVVASGPLGYWRLGESVGATAAFDYAGGHDGSYSNVVLGLPGFSASDPNTSAGFDPTQYSQVIVTDSAAFNFTGSSPSFSYEAWAKFNDLTGIQRLFSNGQPGNSGLGFGINTANGLRFTTYGIQDFDLTLPTPLEVNKWYHIAGVASGGTFYFYVNGRQVGAVAFSGAAVGSSRPFILGNNPVGAQELVNGQMDEAAFYGHALTADEIATHYSVGQFGTTTAPMIVKEPAAQVVVVGAPANINVTAQGSLPLYYQWQKDGTAIPGATASVLTFSKAFYTDSGSYSVTITNAVGQTNSAAAAVTVMPPPSFANLTNGLVVHLKFDGNYDDSSGRGNNAQPANSPTFVPGKIGPQALHYNTVVTGGAVSEANYVTLGFPTDLSFAADVNFSVSYWVKFTGLPGDLPFLCSANNSYGNKGVTLAPSYQAGGWSWSLRDDARPWPGIAQDGPDNSINDGKWHNLVHTFDRQGDGITYLDGVQVGSTSTAGLGDIDTLTSFNIGQDPTGTYTEAGQADIDDMGIWRRVLSSYEAISIYAAGQNFGQSFDVYGPVKVTIDISGANIYLGWQAGALQSSDDITNPNGWTTVNGAAPPVFTLPAGTGNTFYRVKLQ